MSFLYKKSRIGNATEGFASAQEQGVHPNRIEGTPGCKSMTTAFYHCLAEPGQGSVHTKKGDLLEVYSKSTRSSMRYLSFFSQYQELYSVLRELDL